MITATTISQTAILQNSFGKKVLAILISAAFLLLSTIHSAFSFASNEDFDIIYNGFKFNDDKVTLSFDVKTNSQSGLKQVEFLLPTDIEATDLTNGNADFRYRTENEKTDFANVVSFKSIGQGPRNGQTDSFFYTLTADEFYELETIKVQPDAGNNNETFTFKAAGQPTTLPVRLISFTAKSEKAKIQLNWVTAQEEMNEKFEIERSLDGKTFIKVGSVKGQGTTNQITNYQWQEAINVSGIAYYRLKQTDLNGHYEYSAIISVKNLFSGQAIEVKAYPTPTTGIVSIKGLDAMASETTATLFSATGQLLKTIKLETPDFSIDLSHLQDGFYFLAITQNGQTNKLRLVKRQ